MPFSGLGMWEMLLIFLVALLLFGAKRLPEIGSSLGKGIREFKKNITEVKSSIERGAEEDQPVSRQIDAPAASSGDPKKLSE